MTTRKLTMRLCEPTGAIISEHPVEVHGDAPLRVYAVTYPVDAIPADLEAGMAMLRAIHEREPGSIGVLLRAGVKFELWQEDRPS